MATLSNADKRLVKTKSGLRVVAADEGSKSPFELSEPPWMADKESPDCTKCHAKFDFLTRRHHCRRCGQIYCGPCCEQKVQLPRMCFIDPVRMCSRCADVTTKENEFYEKHLKVLAGGANFQLYAMDQSCSQSGIPFFCRLSTDHRKIEFDGGSLSHHEPVSVSRICSIKILRSGLEESSGGIGVAGAEITYAVPGKGEQGFRLVVSPIPNWQQSVAWITGLVKAVRMARESQDSPTPDSEYVIRTVE